MNSYYPASLFAQYSSENPHMTPNVGYSSGNYGLFASRFAEQMGYHNANFGSDHHQRVANTYPAHQNHETSIYGREHGLTNGRIPGFPGADDACHRSFNSCNTSENTWNQTSHSPDSTNNSNSPYSSSLDAQNGNGTLIQKDMKDSHSPEPTTPYYPWMGIVGKCRKFCFPANDGA